MTTALEKLKDIPIGNRIKISDCDTIEVQYVIWRTGKDEYKIEIKNYVDTDNIRQMIWKEFQDPEEPEPMPEDFELTCYYYETIEGQTAQQILELGIAHDIEVHELCEIPTETTIIEGGKKE